MSRILPFLFVKSVFADGAGGRPPQINSETIQRLVNAVTSKILPIAGLLAFIFVVYGGYMWMISAGDPEKIKRSQGVLTWSIIGLVFTILVEIILSAILKAVK